jgi:hypothetical protein
MLAPSGLPIIGASGLLFVGAFVCFLGAFAKITNETELLYCCISHPGSFGNARLRDRANQPIPKVMLHFLPRNGCAYTSMAAGRSVCFPDKHFGGPSSRTTDILKAVYSVRLYAYLAESRALQRIRQPDEKINDYEAAYYARLDALYNLNNLAELNRSMILW